MNKARRTTLKRVLGKMEELTAIPSVLPVLETVVTTIGNVIAAAAPVIAGLVQGIGTVVSALAPVFQVIFDGIGQKVGSVLEFVGSKMGWIQNIIGTVAPVVADILTTAWGVISPVMDLAISVFKLLFNVVQTVFNGIASELDQTQRTIVALENQLTISTSTHLLPRHERLFALPVNTTESLEVRRARVLAKLNTRGTTTVRAIRDMVEIITGREGDVIEHFEDYAFSVLIKLLPADATTDVQELIRQIEEIKPAHLLFDIIAAFRPTPLVHENRLVFHRLATRFSASNSRGTPFIRFDGSVHFDGSSQFNQAPDGISLWRAAFRTSFSNREAVTGMGAFRQGEKIRPVGGL